MVMQEPANKALGDRAALKQTDLAAPGPIKLLKGTKRPTIGPRTRWSYSINF